MIAVGIDVSKYKSTIAVLNGDCSIRAKPFTLQHKQTDLGALVDYLKSLEEELVILMEYTGHYHYPILKKLQDEGFSVCLVNPYQMKKYGDVEIHKSKTDKKDAILLSDAQNAADEEILHMQLIAETIPEYKVLRAMKGVGDRLGPVIIAEIGDIRRFHSAKALNSFAGNDAPPYQSGQFESKNRHISKRGSSILRKACYQVMQCLKASKPEGDPIYEFIIKKELEGKPLKVAKMAGVNKFLRIYYARAMELYK